MTTPNVTEIRRAGSTSAAADYRAAHKRRAAELARMDARANAYPPLKAV